jgi:hypothetical protein
MSKKGGYLIIDLKNYDLLAKIEGTSALPIKYCKELIQLLEQNFNKQVLISGITINKIEKNDCITNIHYYNGYYNFTLYGLSFKLDEKGLKPSNTAISDYKEYETPLTSSTNYVKISVSDFPHNRNIYVFMRIHNTTDGSNDIYGCTYIPIITNKSYVIQQTGNLVLAVEVQEDYFILAVNGEMTNLELYIKLYYID